MTSKTVGDPPWVGQEQTPKRNTRYDEIAQKFA